MKLSEWKKDLDPEIIRLVRALNLTPGITTTQSCYGHDDQHWWVSFEIDQRPEGWGSLMFLAMLTRLFNDGEELMHLSVIWGCFGLDWKLESSFGAVITPDNVAERIECLAQVPPPPPELSYREAVFDALEPAMVYEALRYAHVLENGEDDDIETSSYEGGSTVGHDGEETTHVMAS